MLHFRGADAESQRPESAVVASYLIAMFVIPAFSAKLLRADPNAATKNPGSDSGLESPAWFESMFGNLLRLRHVVVLVAIVMLAGAGMTLTTMGQELFPPVDSNQFTIYARLPSGTRIEITERVVAEIESSIMDQLGEPDPDPEDEKDPDSNLRILISNIGVLMDWPAAYTPNNGPMDAFILVQLKGDPAKPNTFETVDALRERLNREYPSVEFAFDTGGMMTAAMNFGLPSPIQVQVSGFDLPTMQEIAGHIKRVIEDTPGTTDVRIAQRVDYPQIGIEVDRVKAAQLGLVQEDVIKNVVTAVNSSIGFNPAFWIASNFNHYFIGAQYEEQNITSLETLRDIPITGRGSKQPVPLRNVADFYRTTGPAVVNHHNITRVTDIFANVATGHDAGSVARAIEASLQSSQDLQVTADVTERGTVYDIGADYKDRGFTFMIKGETKTMRSAFWQFLKGLGIAGLLVYLAMVAQLRSFSIPFIILASVPLGFIGVVAALKITDTNLSIPAFMGIIMMTGIVVEYSIILLEFANQRVRDGLSVRQAIQEATWIRLRPILMTSLTTWLALIPMAIGAAGGEANAPLARTVIGGVLAATVLTLVVVPCLYVFVKREPATATVST